MCGERHRPSWRSEPALRFIPACAGNAISNGVTIPTCTVHPRVCGERQRGGFAIENKDGSSPRVRGTPRHACASSDPRRFIPACAGNAGSPAARAAGPPVHPRVCGERRRGNGAADHRTGSSPRVRGTPVRGAGEIEGGRFIPACAGNASSAGSTRPDRPVHPRVCGERDADPPEHVYNGGSSPRVRGTLDDGVTFRLGVRFIPACAGNAVLRMIKAAISQVHPRVCGERPKALFRRLAKSGSSPRVRGTPRRPGCRCASGRFIPACAGNASSSSSRASSSTVHPRVCGERVASVRQGRVVGGSSPRVRGTQPLHEVAPRRRRFIPACAGNARAPCPWRAPCPVHPRVCGERKDSGGNLDGLNGSSPRVRGTHHRP